MPVTACIASSSPLFLPVRTRRVQRNGVLQRGGSPAQVSTRIWSSDLERGFEKLSLSSSSLGLNKQLHPIHGSKHHNNERSLSLSIACAAALNARCAASGQTQTLTREAPASTKAPVREPTKTPKLAEGGPGLPPRGDGGGGGGGGGGGESFSGGFFLLGFLGFLSFLKDLESDYKESRRS